MQDDVDAARRAAEAGRLDEAQGIYERTLAESPDSPFLYRELAIIERRNGNLDAALGHARKAAELSPSEPRNFVALGEIYEAQSDFAKAAEAYRTANSLEPSDALQAKLDELSEKAAWPRCRRNTARSRRRQPSRARSWRRSSACVWTTC